jgi:hypothetical protein
MNDETVTIFGGRGNENDVTVTIYYLVSYGNDVTVTVSGNDAHLCLLLSLIIVDFSLSSVIFPLLANCFPLSLLLSLVPNSS